MSYITTKLKTDTAKKIEEIGKKKDWSLMKTVGLILSRYLKLDDTDRKKFDSIEI